MAAVENVEFTIKHCGEFEHDFSIGPMKKIFNLPGSQDCFEFTAKVPMSCGNRLGVLVAITPINRDTRYTAKVRAFHGGLWQMCTLDNGNQDIGDLIAFNCRCQVCGTTEFEVDFEMDQSGSLQSPVVADLKEFIERGPKVTLVGTDGSVVVPKRLLEMRAEVFEAMFKPGTKESETMTIELKDFNSKSLDAFGHFLVTGQIKDGKETALDLVLLGDKYNIQAMKQAAENFVLKHFKELDQTKAVDMLAKVSPDFAARAFLKLSESIYDQTKFDSMR